MQHLVGRTPEAVQQSGTRWQLATLRAACTWLAGRSLAGVSKVRRRCHLSLKRSRDHLRSPDPHNVAKLADIVRVLEESAASAGRVVVVFLDEFTFYRQPTASRDWCRAHKTVQPLAQRAHQSDTTGRLIAALNALTGAVAARVVSKTTTTQRVRFWQDLRAQYLTAEKLYVVLDNWPVHFPPAVLAASAPQQTPWEWKTPGHWTATAAKARAPPPPCPCNSCRCRPTPRGATPSRSCGASYNKRSCTCIAGPRLGPR